MVELQKIKDELLLPLSKRLKFLHPNYVTLLSLLFSILYILLIINNFTNKFLLSFIVLLIGFLDGLDGAIARISNKVTKFGEFLDAYIDRICDFLIFLGIALIIHDIIFVFIVYFISILSTYATARIETWTIGVKIRYKGLAKRAYRILLIFIFLPFNIYLALWLILILSIIDNIFIILYAYKQLR